MTDEQDARRGKEAQAILESPIYAEAFTGIEAETIRLWKDARNAADREQLHQFLMMLGRVQTALASVMRSGEVASAEIARKQSKAEQMAAVKFRAA